MHNKYYVTLSGPHATITRVSNLTEYPDHWGVGATVEIIGQGGDIRRISKKQDRQLFDTLPEAVATLLLWLKRYEIYMQAELDKASTTRQILLNLQWQL